MITHVLLSDFLLHDAAAEKYNRVIPADGEALFSKQMRDFVEKVTALAHSAVDPSACATNQDLEMLRCHCELEKVSDGVENVFDDRASASHLTRIRAISVSASRLNL